MYGKIKVFVMGAMSVLCQIVLAFAVYMAYKERGYFSIGGEYSFLLASLIFMYAFAADIRKFYKKKYEELRQRHAAMTRKYIALLYEAYGLKHSLSEKGNKTRNNENYEDKQNVKQEYKFKESENITNNTREAV